MRIKPIRQSVEPTMAPRVRAPLGLTSGLAQGLGQMGRALEGAGLVGLEIAGRIKDVDNAASLINLEAEAGISYAEHHQRLYGVSHEEIDEVDKEGLESISKDFDDKAREISPEVAAMWKGIGTRLNANQQVRGMPVKRQKLEEYAISTAFTFMDSKRDLAVNAIIANDEGAANAIFREVDGVLELLRTNVGVPARSIESWSEGFERDVRAKAKSSEDARKKRLREADKLAEKEKTEELEVNFGTMVNMYSEGQLSEEYIREEIEARRIDPDKGFTMIKRLRADVKVNKKEDIKNNPIVVGRLASDIELGLDVTDRLESALNVGQIKPETYITFKKLLGDREFKRGLYYINRALQPSPADRWTPDKNLRHAEAIDSYQLRVGKGEDPVTVAREIVDMNIGHIRRTISGLSRPRYLVGEKTNIADLALAKVTTINKYQSGAITVEEFNREAKLIKSLERIAEQLVDETVDTEITDRIKKSEELRKR